jgi:trk system potassium uptake protein TrkA
MRVLIAGAGKVGRSIAAELLEAGHEVVLIDRNPKADHEGLPSAVWITADACEIATLEAAGLDRCQVVIAATGDDKVNLVVSLLAKTEYGVPRVVSRVNHPKNEWLFNESWGVDVAVSSPRLLSALVEEAVTVGDLVRLLSLRQGKANLVEWTLARGAALVGDEVGSVPWPPEATLVAILREGQVIAPSPDDTLEAGDELLFVSAAGSEEQLAALLSEAPAAADRNSADRNSADRNGADASPDADPGPDANGSPDAAER